MRNEEQMNLEQAVYEDKKEKSDKKSDKKEGKK